MKIAILTLRLHINNGGILQAYALMKVLKRMGHEPWLILNQPFTERFRFAPYIIWGTRIFQKLFLGKKQLEVFFEKRVKREYHSRYLPIRKFIEKYMQPQTSIVCTTREWSQLPLTYHFDAYVVGSDQVWRPLYAQPIERYFFSFLKHEKGIKRLAYAASFGTEEWTFSPKQTKHCRQLLQLFDGVSVREASGVRLCRDYLLSEAIRVLDPTLLLTASDYRALLPTKGKDRPESELFVYFLDTASWKDQLKDQLQQVFAWSDSQVNDMYASSREKQAVPPIEYWLDCFDKTRYVITDSFHACVFSILFHRSFWVCGNAERGMARFHSLLSLFGLENRLLSSNTVSSVFQDAEPIDWDKVDQVLDQLRNDSINFLQESLA